MTRWLPHPRLTLALFLVWLLLSGSVSPGAVALGAVLALVAGQALRTVALPRSPARLGAAVALTGTVMREVVRSNTAVARIILAPRPRARTSGFVRIPLDMRHPFGLAGLACIITATPGTIWVEYDSAGGTLLLHVLDLVDEEEWIRTVKERYEKRLMEIFE